MWIDLTEAESRCLRSWCREIMERADNSAEIPYVGVSRCPRCHKKVPGGGARFVVDFPRQTGKREMCCSSCYTKWVDIWRPVERIITGKTYSVPRRKSKASPKRAGGKSNG